ncbi:MAG: TIGR01212 family radical SAM protein [Candidatus Raymondbacteria bacterium RifOxyA12_full_50_37]|uniref:TIGR01212 family radical SAM protein n=1 Tax=Candidatus Raymondbacteria bacterium RIFOXYD12_FULL_49_13 TaxID=1817890 RepID=A0A1F7F540_UNCRA|nr:MAG: TIGR01212 family radical SAM protein [Candidatus Raymondbacteria bacterium RifOxyA12_full_50_37]OGJ89059.1 MAG: TIGR01212 family radical SAM protein [Candidatus Raymondbacteria bacterium RIFOXYA2_FULL_49_16]OGJ95362.1 MAG: TIGR01212 family radical SAM protein [Candidatus Raymondbacteria bacterium RifOxyB12_full_50_8]OGJ97086.1 MAG: TIGR01212 family radical SAM protein [Candidatus Raymondbacteria bacterium RIFOXYC2_FULL_50_21]OGK01785.1 MAG: TIGR01212 family radical SAM protein [Candidat
MCRKYFLSVAPYNKYSDFLKKRFGVPVRKIMVDAGFTCPNRDDTAGTGGCVFCNNESFSPAVGRSILPVREQVLRAIACRQKKETSEKYIVYFQPYSNTYKPTQELDRLYREALCHPDIAGIAVGTRPDCVDRDKISVLAALARETYVSIEYGVQTIHDTTLHAINRGHDFASLLQAMKITRNQGLDICFHVILGLPGETREQMRQTATTLGTLGYNSLKIHNLHVVKNTSLEAEFKKGTLVLPTLEEHASLAVDFLERTPRSVVIQRLCGDAPRDFFIAPLWCLEKQALVKEVEMEFKKRQTEQGSLS